MFYTHAILTKRGPLARLWLAAHWDKKLTKAQIFETDIRLSCESILEPCLKLALRTKGHLLLGVVRIYSRKTKYLLADCNEAFIKIKMAFRPGIVGVENGSTNSHANVDAETREVSIAAITLPDNFHDFDLIDLNIDYIDDPTRFQIHQARAEEITLKEDFITVPMTMEDDFGDVNVLDEPEFFRNLETSGRVNGQTSNIRMNNSSLRQDQSLARPLSDDPFALDGFGDLDAPASVVGNNDDQYDHVMSPFHQDDQPVPTTTTTNERMDVDLPQIPGADETTLLSNVSDEFVLPPILTTGQTPAATRHAASKRKRKLIIDEIKEIDSFLMKTQLTDTTDIVGVLELAPPTRRLMFLKETGGVDKLFSSSSSSIYSKSLQQILNRHFITKSLDQMPPDNAQSQHDDAMERIENHRDESSLEQIRAAAHSFFDVVASPNVSTRKRLLSGNDQSNLDKRPRFDSIPPPITPMDNFMDEFSPTRKSARKTVEDLPLSPTRTIGNSQTSKRKKISGHKENQDELDDEDEEQGQTTTTTQEDFESGKKLNRRAKIMLNAFERAFDSTETISFHDHLASGNPNYHTRKLTAQKFYTLLVLKKLQAVDVEQNEPFTDITVTPGANFHQLITSNGR